MSVKYIADTHLFDPSSLLWRTDYKSMDDYADDLIRKWNMKVSDDDTVIHVGDIGEPFSRTLEVLRELNGHKVLVLGNHDTERGMFVWPEDIFQGVYNNITQGGVYITHKPIPVPTGYTYVVHGHHHTYAGVQMLTTFNQYVQDTYRLNCAADLIGNKPLTLNELIINKENMIMLRR